MKQAAHAYELTVVMPTDSGTQKNNPILDEVEKLFAKLKIEMVGDEAWGEKQLAYPIRKQEKALFHFYRLNATPKASVQLDTQIKHVPGLLRWLLVSEETAPAKEAASVSTKASN